MEKSAAEEWIAAFKTFVNDNTTSFKIPVLYEHNNKTEFIPFGKVPNDIMFNHITLKYAALVAAAYGMSLSDIGLQTTTASGETLAGSIRQERRTRKTGFARIKAKTKAFFDQILPPTLEFNWIDYDDELNVALGRARLATSQAFKTAQDQGWFSAQEVRSQWIQDGLVSISLPDEIPPDAKPLMEQQKEMGAGPFAPKIGGNTEPELIKNPKAPSGGGEGDIGKSFSVKPRKSLVASIKSLSETIMPVVLDAVSSVSEDELLIARSAISESIFDEIDQLEIQKAVEGSFASSVVSIKFEDLDDVVRSLLGDEYKEVPITSYVQNLEASIKKSINGFIGRAAAYMVVDTIFSETMFAGSGNTPYNLIDIVQSRMENSLEDFVAVHVRDEVHKTIRQIELEN